MKKVILGAAALVLGLAITGEASANGPRGHGSSHRPYYASHGTKFRGGYYFSGYNHSHWGYKSWNVRYNRYHYWEPTLKCFYYWCPVNSCYYPVDYGF